MTTLDQLERAVRRLNGDLLYAGFAPTAVTRTPDLRLLLSERAELLATVERMRGALERIADPRNIHFAGDAQVVARAAVTTGEATTPNAGEMG